MSASNPARQVSLVVDAGRYDREDCLVHVPLDMRLAASAFEAERVSVRLTEVDDQGNPLRDVPAQLDSQGLLTWLVAGYTSAGVKRRYIADLAAPSSPGAQVDITTRADHLVVSAAGELVTRYVFLGVWKPYLYPLMGRFGSVVRGASGEHQHQTGVLLGYGGHPHGDPSPANIWSDWDEPPYGPCGKMLHGAFERVQGGPVYGHIVERVAYIRPTGYKILDEARDMRIYALPGGATIVDISIRVPPPDDPGSGPFMVAARVADSMRVWDIKAGRGSDGKFPLLDPPGRIENSEGQRGPDEADGQHARWCDYSGKIGEGWGGITILDHPDNHGFPGRFHAGGYGCLSVSYEYPPDVPPGGSATFRVRVCAHAGDAQEGRVAQKYQDFADPPSVTATWGA